MKNYIKRVSNLINSMDKNKYQTFFEGDKDDALDTVEEALDSFSDYYNIVQRQVRNADINFLRYQDMSIEDRNCQHTPT